MCAHLCSPQHGEAFASSKARRRRRPHAVVAYIVPQPLRPDVHAVCQREAAQLPLGGRAAGEAAAAARARKGWAQTAVERVAGSASGRGWAIVAQP
jgi:hypothetical protein